MAVGTSWLPLRVCDMYPYWLRNSLFLKEMEYFKEPFISLAFLCNFFFLLRFGKSYLSAADASSALLILILTR